VKRALTATAVAVAFGAVLWGPARRLLTNLANTVVRSEHVRPDASASSTRLPPEEP
jgi:hypothetical protein